MRSEIAEIERQLRDHVAAPSYDRPNPQGSRDKPKVEAAKALGKALGAVAKMALDTSRRAELRTALEAKKHELAEVEREMSEVRQAMEEAHRVVERLQARKEELGCDRFNARPVE